MKAKRRSSVLVLVVCLGLAMPALAATTLQLAVGTATTVYTTQLDSKASNAWLVASATIDNRIAQTLNGYLICRLEWNVSFTVGNPTAAGGLTGWFRKTVDGTNFEDTPNSTVALGRPPDFFLPVTTGQGTTRVMVDVRCPAERFQVVGNLTNTGQTTAASGNTLKILPITIQGN